MEQIIITKPNGNSFPLLSKRGAINVKSATQNIALLGEDVVNISVESTKKQNYEIGETINIFGRTYKMNQLPKMQKTGTHSFSYDLVFEGVQYDLIRVTYDLTIDTTNNQLQDFQANTLTGNLRRFAEVLLANVARVFPQKWELGTCPETVSDKTLTFGETDNCLLVLQNLCKEFGTEFYIEQKNGKNIVHFGKVGQIFPHSFSYGKGKGLYKLERQNVSSSNIITRLKVYGSTKNITNKYRANRLCLPNKSKQQSHIENPEMIAKYGIWEATKHFENIAPTRTGTITSVVQGNVFKFVDTEMFDLNEKEADGQTTKYLLPGTTAKIHFNTGNLAGYQFDVQSYDHATRTFTIKKLTDERNDTFPNASSVAFQFAVGDKYKLIDIALPPEFEQQAEQDLLQAGQKYYEQNSQPKVQYALSVSEDFVKHKLAGKGVLRNVFSVGDYIPIVDEDIDVNKSIRIQSFQREIFKPYQYTLTISDSVSTSIVNRIISDLIEVDKIVQINQLQDPAKAKRGWRDSQEIFNKVFDNEGYFDTGRIKPLSIDTGMINVGSRMQQFTLPNVILSVENNNTSVRNTAGQLVHLTIEDTPRTWQIPESVQTNIDADFHYIYVRAWRIGSMASIYISKEQIKVDAEAGYYYFLAGSLGSVENGFRRVKTTYGFTQVSPGEITTGRIAPPSGSHYIELTQDSINVVGNLHITDGNLNQIKQSISPDLLSLENRLRAYSEQKVNDLQVGGRNLAKSSKIQTGKGTNKTSQELLKVNAYILSEPQIRQQVYTVSFWAKATGSQKRFRPFISGTQAIGTFNLTDDFAYYTETYTAATTINHIHFYGVGIEEVEVKDFKLEKGTKATDWSLAPEDLQTQITAEQQARQQAINLLQNSITQATQSVSNLNTYVDGAFKDDIISRSEAVAIEKYLNGVNETMSQVEATFSNLYGNVYLSGTAKATLLSANTALNSAKTELQKAINVAIAGGYTSAPSKRNVNNKFSLFNEKLKEFQEAVEGANKSIQLHLNTLNEQKVNQAKTATEAYARQQSELVKTLAIAHADGKVSESEQRQIANATQKLQEAKTYAEQKVNELQIGGRNLAIGSLTGKNWSNYIGNRTFKQVNNTKIENYIHSPSYTLRGNTEYILSFWSKNSDNLHSAEVFILPNDYNTVGLWRFDIQKSGDWVKNTFKFKSQVAWGANRNAVIRFDNNGSINTQNAELWIKDVMLIEGNKELIDYIPPIEDTEQRLADVRSDLETALENAQRLLREEDRNIKAITEKLEQKTDFINGTKINGNTVATGAMIVGNHLGGNAGINGSGFSATDVRFWAGSNFANRANAPYRVLDNGDVYTSKLHALNGCHIGSFEITENGLSYKVHPRSEQGVKMFYDSLNFYGSSDKTFHRMGTQVFSSSSGTTCFSFIQNKDDGGVGSIISLGKEINQLPYAPRGLGQYINCPNGTALYLDSERGTALEIKKGIVRVDGRNGIDTVVRLGNTTLTFRKGILVEHTY